MRRAVRRLRAAKDTFSPLPRYKGARWSKRRFLRKGPTARSGGKARNGFYCGDTFVSLDRVPEEVVHVSSKAEGRAILLQIVLRPGVVRQVRQAWA